MMISKVPMNKIADKIFIEVTIMEVNGSGRVYQTDGITRHYCIIVKTFKDIEDDLYRFSERISSEIDDLGFQCEKEKPYVQTFDAWGNRIDELVTCEAWKKMHTISAEEGLISLGYDNPKEEWRRLHQMSKLYIFASSSGLYSCPLAMTDGAATIIRRIENPTSQLLKAFQNLTSRNPKEFWTSGQWMTEKKGGSDVASGTETVAVEQDDGSYRLYGYKWFSSATDSDMAFTLARVVDKHNNITEGTKGLSLFYLETKKNDGSLNNIQIMKLKDKLGTRQLPTAELLLDGTSAVRVSELGRGVAEISNMLTISRIHTAFMAISNMRKTFFSGIPGNRNNYLPTCYVSELGKGVAGISSMLTLTRIHNAVAACSSMRKLLILSKDYSFKREAFGNQLYKYPLHVQTLARLETEVRAATLFVFHAVLLLSKQESGNATEDELHLLRLLTPLIKLYTGKQAMSVSSEGLESFGGQGYIEETGLPNFLRDAQVLTIWEGTTNILSLDVLRCISKSNGQALISLKNDVDNKLSTAPSDLSKEAEKLQMALKSVLQFVTKNQENLDVLTFAARDLSYSLSRIYMGTLMIEHTGSCGMSPVDIYACKRWCEQQLSLVSNKEQYSKQSSELDKELVYG
ncbi:Acyl-CoA dehydrogenase family member 11 [Mytilus coruscus]|uniref:Acyl-CoA dehydrogenase family member 11 n=1 Tax=Mytilus coruscus TaxID=42192 RepID=A0A6J8EWF1_MYTCO|nr:Acyl-CoA dehydrogenase family member 11 [Mytilus coruscus]